LLNKIEIGQFLSMKYRVGNKNTLAVYGMMDPLINGYLIMTKNNCEESIMEQNNTKGKAVGYLLFNGSPCLLIKILSAVYVTLLALASKYGVTVNITKNTIIVRKGEICLNISTTPELTVIPSQNIKFQKLSRLQRDVSQFIPSLILKVISQSLAWFRLTCQAKLTMISIFLLTALIAVSARVHADNSNIVNLIKITESQYDIPSGLLLALANVESNYQPYALNIAGKSVISNSAKQAEFIAERYLQQGKKNIDIGVMQLNYFWHGKHFASVSEMFDLKKNINYAASLLTSLYKQHGSWHKAVQHYHSANPQYHRQYSQKVLVAWLAK
jgi:hypothetical protein